MKIPKSFHNGALFLKNGLIGLVLGVCITGFVWICYAQVHNFLSKTTSISTTWITGGSNMKFPIVVFCSTIGYKPWAKTSYVSKETYDNISTPVDVKLAGIIGGFMIIIEYGSRLPPFPYNWAVSLS
jgi:hypothetical protein